MTHYGAKIAAFVHASAGLPKWQERDGFSRDAVNG
jgi:hypothetical protein